MPDPRRIPTRQDPDYAGSDPYQSTIANAISKAWHALASNTDIGISPMPMEVLAGPAAEAFLARKGITSLKDLFVKKVAQAQRGIPEDAMLRVQEAMGGGVLNPVVEHTGDLTHRMAESPTWGTAGQGYVFDKAEKVHRWLTNPYGFQREMDQNIASNANYYGIPAEQLQQKVSDALSRYASAHADIPVFNQTQWAAREAAMNIGKQRFWKAADTLDYLKGLSSGPPSQKWVDLAHSLDTEMLDEYLRSGRVR